MRTQATRPVAGSNFYVLLALADQERYGLGIVQEVERRTDGRVRLGPGTLYNTLKRLLADGAIEEVASEERAGEDDSRRNYYRITAAGRSVVEAEAERLAQLVDVARDKELLPTRPGS